MAEQSAPIEPAGEPAPRLKPEQVYARYIGAPYYLAGLGACDLTREEWEAAGPELTSRALELKLYEIDAPAAPAESAA